MRLMVLLLLLGTARGQDTDGLLERVDRHYNRLTSLRTRYTESYAGMGIHRSETGTLTLKKPGKMVWQYDQPAGKVFVLDGKFAWFYTPGDEQAQKIPAKQMDDLRSPLRFLLGHTELKKELENITISPDGDGVKISGVPHGIESRMAKLILRVAPGSGAILSLQIEEKDGASTEFVFRDMQEGVKVNDATFVPHIPSGVNIVRGMGPV